MDKLRKFGIWCWTVKERVILALVVLLLGYRVFSLVSNPATEDVAAGIQPPGTVPSVEPPPPPPVPRLEPPLPTTPLTRNQLFVYTRPSVRGANTSGTAENEDSRVKVLRIVDDGNDKYRAYISTGSSKKFIAEGDPFESYTLMSIDPDTECCEIYSEATAQTFEVCIE